MWLVEIRIKSIHIILWKNVQQNIATKKKHHVFELHTFFLKLRGIVVSNIIHFQNKIYQRFKPKLYTFQKQKHIMDSNYIYSKTRKRCGLKIQTFPKHNAFVAVTEYLYLTTSRKECWCVAKYIPRDLAAGFEDHFPKADSHLGQE